MQLERRAQRADRARPGRQAFLDDHRIDGTPVLPGVMGIEALRRGRAGAAARLARGRARGRRASARRSSSTATSRARSSCRRCCATAATARWSPTAALVGTPRAARPGRAGDRPLHRPGAAARASAAPAAGSGGCARRGAPDGRRRARRRLPRSTSTAPPTRCSTGPGAATATVRRAARAPTCRRTTSRPGEPTRDRAAADRALLPDRRRLGARHDRADGAADPRRPRHPLRRRGRTGHAAAPSSSRARTDGGRRPGRRRGRATSGCCSRATARSSFPALVGR